MAHIPFARTRSLPHRQCMKRCVPFLIHSLTRLRPTDVSVGRVSGDAQLPRENRFRFAVANSPQQIGGLSRRQRAFSARVCPPAFGQSDSLSLALSDQLTFKTVRKPP